jgi:hypothetical protein
MNKWVIAAAMVASLGAAQAQAANMLVNGDFQTGDLSGWSQFGDTDYTGVNTGSPVSMQWPYMDFAAAYFGALEFGGISQAVGGAGGTYTVSFELMNSSYEPDLYVYPYHATIIFGGTTLLTDPVPGDVVPYSFTVTALDSSGLSFAFQNVAGFYYVDNVLVEEVAPPPPAVPEPASWAMMIAGFGAIGGALRRHRAPTVRFA